MKMTRSNLGLMTATAVGALMILSGGAAVAAPTSPAPAFHAQDHGGGRDSGGRDTGGDSGSDHEDSDHADQDSGQQGQQGQQSGRGRTPGETTDRGNRSLDDILRGAAGNPIALDAEGAPIDPTQAIEVELGRLNVGRSPSSVLDNRAEEVVTMLNAADAVSLDAAGRLVVTTDGVAKTIDSPLENLAIYVALMTQGTIPGVTDLPGTEFDHLVDGVFTTADMVSATSFLAGATDKASVLTADDVAYINAVLDINNAKTGDVTYSDVDYSSFAYDRSDAYADVTAEVLVKQPNGTWVTTTVNVYDVVFGGEDYTGSGTFSAFTQAAEDSRAIVNYIHEYAVPADEVQ